jgi:type II secretory pathway pseudopilin PulG
VAAQQRATTKGFTLTELSVLVAVGGILVSVLVADLSQTRQKLLQQACAANMKHWGMAISMYADDYNGTIFYDSGGLHFSDVGSPLQGYFGNTSDPWQHGAYDEGLSGTHRAIPSKGLRDTGRPVP